MKRQKKNNKSANHDFARIIANEYRMPKFVERIHFIGGLLEYRNAITQTSNRIRRILIIFMNPMQMAMAKSHNRP